jgi:hypothetical protein
LSLPVVRNEDAKAAIQNRGSRARGWLIVLQA